MALQMSRMAIFQTAAWRALWIKALTFNRTTLSAIRISLSPNAGTLIATCGGTQLFACSESAGAVDRFAQPFHCELDVLRLQLAPALDLGLVALFRKALEIFRCQLLAAVRSVNFSRMKGSFGFDP